MSHHRSIVLSILTASIGIVSLACGAEGPWTLIDRVPDDVAALPPNVRPPEGQPVRIDWVALGTLLDAAPDQGDPRAQTHPRVITLPLPDGSMAHFEITRSDLLAPELAARYPAIRVYDARCIEDPAAWAVLDRTHQGFHAMVVAPSDSPLGGTFFIDPYSFGDPTVVTSYYRKDARRAGGWMCSVIDAVESAVASPRGYGTRAVIAQKYRIYMAATGEYTAFHSQPAAPNKPAALSALVTALSRVSGIFRRELAVDFQLKGDTDNYIYTDAATDPYTNSSASAMLEQNQEALDGFLDLNRGNYDIGHVCGTGGGGIATLGCVCIGDRKGRGATTGNPPINDPYWVDYVAHEVGHQFGANHTFNASSGGGCTASRRVGSVAYEPGSGSTIMGYAGICTPNANIQANTDPYFHFASHDEISAYTSGAGSCGADIPTSNNPPSVGIPSGGYATIPMGTPFRLRAVGSDIEGGQLTYTWEQRDLGPAQDLTAPDNGAGPLFRSFGPSTNPERVFPRMSDLLSGTTSPGERLPTTARPLRFRVTARDAAYYVGTHAMDIEINVSAAAGPFRLTSHNGGNVAAGPSTVTWNVAGSAGAPVNCQRVNILLSFDDGQSFPFNLALNTANDGSEAVNIPDLAGDACRVMIAAADNIFFDISDSTFFITAGPPPANDTCANATPIGNGSFAVSPLRASASGFLNAAACDRGSRDVYFRYTSACDGVAVFETGATVSAITLFDACPVTDAAVPITCDAYGVGDNYVQSAISMTAGQEVLVRVSSMGDDARTFNLHVSCSDQAPPPPPNDDCTDASPISIGETINGTLINSSWDYWISACEYTSVYYRFTATCHAAEFHCDSGRILSANADICPTGYLAIGSPDEAGFTSIIFNTTPGQVYTICVHETCGYPAGRFNLTYAATCYPAPANDACATAQPLPLNGLVAGTLIGASTAPEGCAAEAYMPCYDDVFYSFSSPQPGLLAVGVQSYSAARPPFGFVIADGCAPDALGLAWDHDAADGALEASTRIEAGRTYIVRIATGVLVDLDFGVSTFLLSTTFVADPPLNDNIADAIAIADETITGSTRYATVDGASSCGASTASPDVWYSWVAPCTGEATFDTSGSLYDTVLSVHRSRVGDASDQLPGGCNDDFSENGASRVTIPVTQGRLYFIRVSGWNGASGGFALHAAFESSSLANGCPAATPLNGGFEQCTNDPGAFYLGLNDHELTHWTFTDVELIGTYWKASDGRLSLNLNGSGPGSISQHIATPSVGEVYLLRFDMAANPEGGDRTTALTVEATDNPAQAYAFTFDGAVLSGDRMGWTTRTYGFVATRPTTLIIISGDPNDGPFGPMIDNIRIEPGSLPDPGAVSFSLSAQFSANANPASAWTLGWFDAASNFHRFTSIIHPYGPAIDVWHAPSLGNAPFAMRNNTGRAQHFETASLPGRAVVLQPGPGNESAGARFDVPYDGTYLIHSWATHKDPFGGDGYSFRVVVDGSEVFTATGAATLGWESILDLTAGQKVDLAIDPQFDPSHDSVAVESIFTRVGDLDTGTLCPADFNQDGGVDGADVDAFFAAWENGETQADVNQDGGIDGGDVDTFFAAWENGGC